MTLIWGLTCFLHVRHELNLFCKRHGFVYVPTGWLSWLPVWDAGLYCSPLCSFNVKVYSESLWQATSRPQANQYIQSQDHKISLEKGGWARMLRKGARFVYCIINHLLAITILKWSATCVWNPWEDQSWFISLTQVKAIVCLLVTSN